MKSFLKVAAFASLYAVASSAMAVGIADTKHNLAGGGGTSDNGQMCVYCHAPHTNNTSFSPPLWNHTATSSLYTVYTSATVNMTIGQPGAESLVCLSCHDGSVAIDAIVNTPEAGWTQGTSRTVATSSFAYMGTDLRSEHPIGITYNTAQDTDFNTIASVTGGSIRLFGGSTNQVECASCHNVHLYTFDPFLRKSNSNSALCLTCHIK